MQFDRQAGVFAHITALPGPHGIGDLGPGARNFLEWLETANQSVWQFCPLGPTAGIHDDSPYQSYSAFAGNPLIISLDDLVADGYLTSEDLKPVPDFSPHEVAYDAVREYKHDRLRIAAKRFQESVGGINIHADTDTTASSGVNDDIAVDVTVTLGDSVDPSQNISTHNQTSIDATAFKPFYHRESHWLTDYALFMALRTSYDGAWTDWPESIRHRDPDALSDQYESLDSEVIYHLIIQFIFDQQWQSLQAAATDRDITLVGDLPIYVALDSADVWATPDVFQLTKDNEPAVVAGVPPSDGDDGQRWGNPVYDWEHLRETEYNWWLHRLDRLFTLVDITRIDHFKGFDAYYAIPVDADTPAAGEWQSVPGYDFFETIREHIGSLPFVVEDLGFIDQALHDLREHFNFPGMRVPHYADWCHEGNMYQPMHYPAQSVAYSSTHDTNTIVGYYDSLSHSQRDCLHYNLGVDGSEINWSIIDAVWRSDAQIGFTTLQDILGLDSHARFNEPGTASGNWQWRCTDSGLDDDLARRLAGLTIEHVRD
ncbi:4-alpha-glucanotransferase [Haloquadratum walsbyi]|uniref:4-alpha-glucanotransferase n=1 Tax=Haloquadratum walsbyi (strain DSM 16854 / JCM 12705 / C23) TaxID=768065 RepID=G0LJC8_HALWC|nr:4-alpha-glucanotransferase [Haloquadratum walsbyi]CCC40696.1 4-alpha-glucanotransferase [Haloquadratum walsbyi C23]